MKNEDSLLNLQSILNYPANKWMSFVDDDIKISQLRIPGTHNSGAGSNPKHAFSKAIQFAAQCHTFDINSQLEMGIRYIDIRLKLDSDSNLNIYHGLIPYSLSLIDVLQIISNFFERNPTECVFVRLHREDGDPGGFEYRKSVSDEAFVGTLVNQLDQFVEIEKKKRQLSIQVDSINHDLCNIIYNEPDDNPNLGNVRGKIIFFGIRHVVNLDVLRNSPYRFREIKKQADFKLKCNDHDIERKKTSILTGMVESMSKEQESSLFVNEVNAIGSSTFFKFIPYPRKMAEIMNPFIETVLTKLTREKLQTGQNNQENDFQGVLMLDFPEISKEGTLVPLIIAQNFL